MRVCVGKALFDQCVRAHRLPRLALGAVGDAAEALVEVVVGLRQHGHGVEREEVAVVWNLRVGAREHAASEHARARAEEERAELRELADGELV